MSIVLNEYKWVEKVLNHPELGKKPVETINRVARYYFENQYKKGEIRKLLDTFLMQCDPSASLVRWSPVLDRIAKHADKFPLIRLSSIEITKAELETIEKLDGKQVKRLAFTLLCTAKYWDAVSEKNNHWVNSPDREIMQMANIKTSVKRQSLLFAVLREAGLIRFSKKIDNLNVQVLFLAPGKTAMQIQDFRNLGYQYLKFYGAPYFTCENCGITVKANEPKKGRRQKYCPSCAVALHTKQKVDSVMRKRSRLKDGNC